MPNYIKKLEVITDQDYHLVLIATINFEVMNSPSTFPSVLRELTRTHQVFLAYAACHVHTLDLTLPQFDIILTLGNTAGMTFKQLGEKTIITKGTLTGVINRLEDKGLVQRMASKTDGRSQIVRLTAAGAALFKRAYPEHLEFIYRIFNDGSYWIPGRYPTIAESLNLRFSIPR